jgi:hypothetical protein
MGLLLLGWERRVRSRENKLANAWKFGLFLLIRRYASCFQLMIERSQKTLGGLLVASIRALG